MKKINSLFNHRFGPVAIVVITVCTLSFLTRLFLLINSWQNIEHTLYNLLGIFFVGFFYDLIVSCFFAIPISLYCWLLTNSFYKKKWQLILLFTLMFVINFLLVLNVVAEIVFWNEFSVRYNFIAVDYLVYTTEVLGNIWESYNIPLIIGVIFISTLIIIILTQKKIIASQLVTMQFKKRTVFFAAFLLISIVAYFVPNNAIKNISNNNYVNELSGNGIYEFGSAYWNNEIDYNRFYATKNDTENIAVLRNLLQTTNATFTTNPLSIERVIKNDSATNKWNIVLISVESLSGDYLKHFGNTENITPFLDSLIPQSLFFENFYASGTRTVRGLEALSLAIPPTPGQSIVRRPNNADMFTMGNVLKSKGYDVNFIYGGNTFFDNMGKFFGSNGYTVLDKRDIPDSLVHHVSAWGLDDEASLNFTLNQCDKSYQQGKLFFNHIMTVSNHRPYTYPDGRIDIPSASQTIAGGVKYTDYAINKFLKDAQQKPWFKKTLFVIVADHCSKSAGKTDLPVNRYHIPCFIYAPTLITPKIEQRLTSQIDLAPTILGLLNLNYTSRFLGYDIYKTAIKNQRAFISTYQDMGFLKDDKLIVLSPQQKINTYIPNYNTGAIVKVLPTDSLIKEAIAWYQGANFLFKNKYYQNTKQ